MVNAMQMRVKSYTCNLRLGEFEIVHHSRLDPNDYMEHKKEFKIKDKHSHDFYKLFMALNENTQKEIKDEFKRIMKNRDMKDVKILEAETKKKISRSLESNLESWRNIFVKARYIYDDPRKVGNMMFFPEIEAALVSVILKRNPKIQP